MSVFMVTILYRHVDGRDLRACVVAETPDAEEAIAAAVQAVSNLPHVEAVLGGMLEELGDDPNAPIARDETTKRPVGATVH